MEIIGFWSSTLLKNMSSSYSFNESGSKQDFHKLSQTIGTNIQKISQNGEFVL